MMTAAAIWSGGYGIEVLLDRLDDKLLLVPIQYVGITTVPVFWFSWFYSYLAFFAGFEFLLYRAFAETSMFRSQMIATIVAGTIPLGANLLFLTDLNPMGAFDLG